MWGGSKLELKYGVSLYFYVNFYFKLIVGIGKGIQKEPIGINLTRKGSLQRLWCTKRILGVSENLYQNLFLTKMLIIYLKVGLDIFCCWWLYVSEWIRFYKTRITRQNKIARKENNILFTNIIPSQVTL